MQFWICLALEVIRVKEQDVDRYIDIVKDCEEAGIEIK